jgi:hypothetical protein
MPMPRRLSSKTNGDARHNRKNKMTDKVTIDGLHLVIGNERIDIEMDIPEFLN